MGLVRLFATRLRRRLGREAEAVYPLPDWSDWTGAPPCGPCQEAAETAAGRATADDPAC